MTRSREMQHFRAGAVAAVLVALLAPAQALGGTCPATYGAGQLDHWANGRVFYQVFVRSFADSDGDGIGDLDGLAARLDYLNDGDPETTDDLGVDAIWLLPITEAVTYHGFDTVNYDRVDLDYGGDAALRRFLAAAHRRGIRVVMDLVVNHCSWQHPWFAQANHSTDDAYHDWFVWRNDDPGWTQPWSSAPTWHASRALDLYYYGLFWSGMPDLNLQNPEVRREMIAVALRWLGRDMDGFRLDASRHIIEAGDEDKAGGSPETHAWWREFGRAVRAAHPDALLLGENWTSIEEVAEYYGDRPRSELDMSFDFELADALVAGVKEGDAAPIEHALCEAARHLPPHALDAPFLTNHDMIRVMTQLGGDEAKARLAASLLLTLPGVPFLYYGEEIGLVNGPGDEDPEKRTPMPWTRDGGFTTGEPWMVNRRHDPEVNVAAQTADPDSLLSHYRRWIRLRQGHAALARGDYRPVAATAATPAELLAFTRSHGDQRVLVVANLGTEPVGTIAVAVDVDAVPLALVPTSATASVDDGELRMGPLSAHAVVVYRLGAEAGP